MTSDKSQVEFNLALKKCLFKLLTENFPVIFPFFAFALKSENAIGSYEFILEEVIELLKKCNENETQLQNDLGVDPIK